MPCLISNTHLYFLVFNKRILCVGQEEELDINALLQWLHDERKKKAAKKAKVLLAKDEKEFSRGKALVAHEEDESIDVSLDGLSYKEAHLAFDMEKSPKLDD